MEGRITDKGNLIIRHAGEFKSQYCPWNRTDEISEYCGDWCALFGEPVKFKDQYSLWLCNKTLYFDKFGDYRPDAENIDDKDTG